jgi:diguanylate cyclase (GGDEF)-like protein
VLQRGYGWLTDVRTLDRGLRRRGRILVTMVAGLMLAATLYLPLALLRSGAEASASSISIATAIVAAGGIVALIRRGRVELGSWLVLLMFAVVLVTSVAATTRVDNAPVFVALLLSLAGATLGVRHVVGALLGSLAILALLYQVNSSAATSQVSVHALVLSAGLMCLLTAVVAGLTAYAVRASFAEADAERLRSARLTADLRAVNAELEERVEQRTAELQSALTTQTALARRLAELSLRDPLTGLHNRRHLDAEVVRMFEEAVRYERPISVVLLDLDDFKRVNDHFGHEAGDEVLRRVARILVDGTRGADLVARYGGEELAIVLPDTDAVAAAELCERIRERVAAEPWHEVRPGAQVTVSIGVADEFGHDTVWHVFREADRQLYAAKAAGKNRVAARSA